MSTTTRALGAVVAGAGLCALAWASTAPLRAARTADALVRLSWGARPERIETCRTQTDEELAKVLPQMRQRVVCEGTTARYRLDVRHDGSPIVSADVRGGGLRHDRELYVFREIAVPAGRSTLRVRFERADSVPSERDQERERPDSGDTLQGIIAPERARREMDERRRRREEAVPSLLMLDTTVTLAAREVLLVTYDPDGRRLVVRSAPGARPVR
ncbi:MAG: hypothetical protein ACHQQ3_10360 [Gemmatimonadales bacterium]